jgi:aminoglycoside phosphotransferase (APT) family kinase protein
MGFVDGLVLADRAAGLQLSPSARLRAADQVIDVLVALHTLDPVSAPVRYPAPGPRS